MKEQKFLFLSEREHLPSIVSTCKWLLEGVNIEDLNVYALYRVRDHYDHG